MQSQPKRKIEFKKISNASKKTLRTTYPTLIQKLNIDNGLQGRWTKTTGYNSTLAIGGVSSPLDRFEVAESSVIRKKFSAEKPDHRQSAKRYNANRHPKNFDKK